MAGQNQMSSGSGHSLGLALLPLALSAALSASVASLFARHAPQPYMDEIFHVPQAQAYCLGRWKQWDPKLTTPPGLYLVSIALSSLGAGLSDIMKEACTSTVFLRGTNVVLLSFLQLAAYQLLSSSPLQAKRPGSRFTWSAWEAVVISLLPPLFFFQFLYYTDVGGAAAVLGMLAAGRSERHGLAASLGFLSLWFRQTNIIWVAFSLGASLLTILRRRGLYDPPASHLVSPLRTLSSLPWALSSLRLSDILLLTPYAPVLLSFLAFLRWNGSIVLGDRSNHVATFHGAQPGYLLGFALFFGWPSLLGSLGGISSTFRSALGLLPRPFSLFLLLLSTVLLSWAVQSFTIAHPFLLADNRHYTFYLWRRLIGRTSSSRLALVPIYVGSGALWSLALGRTHSLLYLLGLLAASCLSLIPSPLIEPRYFLVPFLIMRAGLAVPRELDQGDVGQSPTKGKTAAAAAAEATSGTTRASRGFRTKWLIVEAAWYALINAVTIHIFLFRPFPFTDALGRQTLERFMW